VTLLPGCPTDPIICTLEHLDLSDASTNPYQAISYTWGDPSQTQPITLATHPSYPVTHNLFSALTFLRDRSTPQHLWIDSLCINQADLAERSAQVALMRDIFASAARVTIWLGDYGGHPKDDWHLAFKYMLECAEWAMRPPKTAAEQSRAATVEQRHERGRGLMSGLLARAWFTRVWVVQEVAVKHWREDDEMVKFLVGDLSVPWFVVSRAFGHLIYIREKPTDGTLSQSFTRRNGLTSIEKAWKYKQLLTELAAEGKYVSFAEQLAMYLSRFTYFGTTDQRDRVYSLLGLLVGEERVPEHLAPDYSKPAGQVFHEYTAWMLQAGACVDVLSLGTGPQAHCPSWVPNFAGRRGVFYRNLDDTNPVRLLDDNKLLEIEALPISVVTACGRRCNIRAEAKQNTGENASAEEAEKVFAGDCRQYLLYCEDLLAKHLPVKPPVALVKKHLLTKLKGWAHQASKNPPVPVFADNPPRQRLSKYFEDGFHTSLMDSHWSTHLSRKRLYELLISDPAVAEPDPLAALARPYGKYIADEFDGYSPFICANGEIDFCRSTSAAPEPGDMLCLLRGSTKRYILRPAGEIGEWTLVGSAYTSADFSHAWHLYGKEKETEMRESWAAMWRKKREEKRVINLVIR
jgi:hypothetical protein